MPSLREMAQKKQEENNRIEGNALDTFKPEHETVSAFEGQQEQSNPDALGLDLASEEEPDQDEETEQELEAGIEQEATDEEAALDRAVEQAKQEHALQEGKEIAITEHGDWQVWDLTIDPEFKSLLPPVNTETYEEIKKDITTKGFDASRGSIVVWKESPEPKTAVDGMTRYEICHEISAPFPIVEKSFPNRDAVLLYIINTHINRRSMTPQQQKIYIGMRMELEQKVSGAQLGNKNATSRGAGRVANRLKNEGVTLVPLIPTPEKESAEKAKKTAEKIAEQSKISLTTAKEAKRFLNDTRRVSEKLQKIAEETENPEAAKSIAELTDRSLNISEKDMKALASDDVPPEKVAETIEEIKNAPKATPKAARAAVSKTKSAIKEKERKKAIEEKKAEIENKPSQQIITCGNFLDVPIDSDSIHLVVTSPGYNLGKDYGNDADDSMPYDEYLEFTSKYLERLHKLCRSDGRVCLNVPLDTFKGDRHHAVYSDVLQAALEAEFQYNFSIVWNEGNISSGTAYGTFAKADSPYVIAPVEMIIVLFKETWEKSGGVSTIKAEDSKKWSIGLWDFRGESAKKIGHPAPFPVELPHRCIQMFSYFGDTVLDPFLGSGTTLVACANDDRKGIGVEINSAFCDLARVRVAEAEASAAEKKKE